MSTSRLLSKAKQMRLMVSCVLQRSNLMVSLLRIRNDEVATLASWSYHQKCGKRNVQKRSSSSPSQGIEPWSPAWQAGILATILWRNVHCVVDTWQNTVLYIYRTHIPTQTIYLFIIIHQPSNLHWNIHHIIVLGIFVCCSIIKSK